MSTLEQVAQYVRSKNAGPFWVTIDIFCGSALAFERVRGAKSLSAAPVAKLYGVKEASVCRFEMPDLNVVKISFPRPVAQGSTGDADSHAGQYFVPLLEAVID